ncbi:MAG TPA: hypothetical protein PLN91_01935 [Rhodanobacteraceae bacterium]|nr:hypothetical protein [Rhodanobacteraceae bacterium]
MRRLVFLLGCAVLLAALVSCGNKGDLVKPGTEPAKGHAAAADSAHP